MTTPIHPFLPRALALACAALLAACGNLPSSGPTAREVMEAQDSTANTLGFRIVDLDAPLVTQLGAAAGTSAAVALPEPGADTSVERIGAGDTLNVSVFEVGTTLFGPSSSLGTLSAGNLGTGPLPTAASQAMPTVTVASDGTIPVPYVGRVRAAGRTPRELEEVIRAGLRGKSQDPQVIVSVRENLANSVLVMGEVRKPGRLPLSTTGERVLDMVALAGGAAYPLPDVLARLTRGRRTLVLPLGDIAPDSDANLLLQPQDRLLLEHRPRTYSVFGAAGKVSQVPFDTAELNLAEAVAKVGGPGDLQADPSAVFIFRYQQEAQEAQAAPSTDAARPVIYRLDLMKPASYFLAQRFAMRDKDVVFIANAESNSITKFVSILNLLFSPVYTGHQFLR
ncbi:polysaccharide biosynthesis/export family protein [Cupriavidus basilensis]|uniref:polysaccharide biosynthesis/export family protein n=1 Tax=Cupriavidus basilensis TaxID=68895 RepID=UPI000751A10D|nr:polysaccharide biosynthesis/export family protein [Cupriavidus basilensis]